MPKPRVTSTDRLSNVIDVVQLGRRTGMLAVERDFGGGIEEGEIYFRGGRAVYALLPGLRGSEALSLLLRWGQCRFSFDPTAPLPTPNVSGVLPGEGLDDPRRSTGGLGGPSSSASNSWPQSFPGVSGPIGPTSPTPSFGSGSLPSMPAGADHTLLRRPRRAPDVRDLMTIVTTYNLSRGHRTILLLADGEHSVLDLARLSSKSVDEVGQLLGELEAYGLVYYY